jgi:Icc-related predicted phosphoesterase
MKVQILSDLHIEFEDYAYPQCDCDVVVLAGDIHTKDRGLKWALENIQDKPVIYVLGNHEFYGKTYQKLITELKVLAAGTNVHLLEKDVVSIDGINFLGCTLWTNFEIFGDPRIAGYECQQNMTDYKKIKRLPGYSKIRSLDTAIYHKQSMDWLKKTLPQYEGQNNVVVTHHGPSMKSSPECYKEDVLTAAYVSDLDAFIETHKPNIWVHGHLHNNSDYVIGETRVLCNPKGYPSELNPDYDPLKTFEI